MKINKAFKIFLIVLASLAALVLLCVGLYSIGFLDVFIIFVLIPGIVVASLACFIVNLVSVMRLKGQNEPIPSGKKIALAVSGVVLFCVLSSVIALVAVFAMAIAFM